MLLEAALNSRPLWPLLNDSDYLYTLKLAYWNTPNISCRSQVHKGSNKWTAYPFGSRLKSSISTFGFDGAKNTSPVYNGGLNLKFLYP